jgi:hypothetical protein
MNDPGLIRIENPDEQFGKESQKKEDQSKVGSEESAESHPKPLTPLLLIALIALAGLHHDFRYGFHVLSERASHRDSLN